MSFGSLAVYRRPNGNKPAETMAIAIAITAISAERLERANNRSNSESGSRFGIAVPK
jgi:hypothetical protein